ARSSGSSNIRSSATSVARGMSAPLFRNSWRKLNGVILAAWFTLNLSVLICIEPTSGAAYGEPARSHGEPSRPAAVPERRGGGCQKWPPQERREGMAHRYGREYLRHHEGQCQSIRLDPGGRLRFRYHRRRWHSYQVRSDDGLHGPHRQRFQP